MLTCELSGKVLKATLTGDIYPGMYQEWKSYTDGTKPEAVELEICSDGGSVIDAFALYNSLKKIGHVTATVTGWAASAATIILMAADEIRMYSNSFLMIHEPSLCLWEGNLTECRKAAGILETMRDTIAEAYAKRTAVDADTLKAMMQDETWMSAEEAKECGFCDTILDDAVEIAAKIKIPENLKERIMGKKLNIPTDGVECTQVQDTKTEPDKKTTGNLPKNEGDEAGKEPEKKPDNEEGTEPDKEPETEEPKNEGDEAEEDPLKKLEDEAEELRKQVENLTAENEELRKQCEGKDCELNTLKARAAQIAAGLKVTPRSETVSDSGMTWNEAMKACNGDYVAARKKFPEVFKKLIENNKR